MSSSIFNKVALALALAGAVATQPACMIGPKNGDVIEGATIGKGLSFTGYYKTAKIPIDVQVLAATNLDPNVAASWVTIGSTLTVTTPTTVNDPDPLFQWTVNAVPVPTFTEISRWPLGGLLRVRAVAHDPGGDTTLATFDNDFGGCYATFQNQSWKEIGKQCKSAYTGIANVVSTQTTPADNAVKPPYLSRKGAGSIDETKAYYGAVLAPKTLDEFKQRFNFDKQGNDQAGAIFFNQGDLGIGREMHCVTFNDTEGPGKACYVKNYGVDAQGKPVFGGDVNSALEDAVFRRKAFATVAMWRNAGFSGSSTNFVVYDPQGNQLLEAQLDSTGQNKSIPQNCINCHGGLYDATAHRIKPDGGGAHFLPFNPEAFKFSTRAGFTFQDQASSFRKLNAHVVGTGAQPTASIQELINGWYAPKAVTDPTAVINTKFVPTAWNGDKDQAKMYNEVFKPFCRTCHVTSITFPFDTFQKFSGLGSLIVADACTGHTMPHAEATLKNYWRSPARAHLVGAFGKSGAACNP